jgi:hypothetical protein
MCWSRHWSQRKVKFSHLRHRVPYTMFLLEYCTFSEYCAHCARAAYFSGDPAVRKFGRTNLLPNLGRKGREKGRNFFHFFYSYSLKRHVYTTNCNKFSPPIDTASAKIPTKITGRPAIPFSQQLNFSAALVCEFAKKRWQ